MSIHVWKAQAKAAKLGAMAGEPEAAPLWDLSKRELVEVALRLADAINGASCDTPAAMVRVNEELAALRAQRIV